MAESWKSVARALAIRLEHQPHPCHNPVEADCGNCRDALAYQRYVKRLAADGVTVPDPLADAVELTLVEIRQRTEGES